MGGFSSLIDLLELFTESDYSNSPAKKKLRSPATTPFSSQHTTDQLTQVVRSLMASDRKLDAIKLVQEKTGWDLHACSRFVENTANSSHTPYTPHQNRHAHTTRSRQTAIDTILQQQKESEHGGGGLSIYEYLLNIFRKR